MIAYRKLVINSNSTVNIVLNCTSSLGFKEITEIDKVKSINFVLLYVRLLSPIYFLRFLLRSGCKYYSDTV